MKFIFSDLDGTLTDLGRIGPDFLELISLLKKNNYELIIVSGRSLSWGHFLLTHFDLKYCIMEAGGVIVYKDEKSMIKSHCLCSDQDLQKLQILVEDCFKQYPNLELSEDSFGRLTDRAFDLRILDEHTQTKLKKIICHHSGRYSESSVHLNFWIGNISKYLGVKYFIENFTDLKLDWVVKNCYYFGDSLNDESLFEAFDCSIGVSNVERFLTKLKNKPKVILTGDENREIQGVLSFIKQRVIF